MANSDNRYGTFNKKTTIFSQIDDGSTALTTFATVSEAKSFFFTAEALAVYDECCTELQWALVGTTGLKRTMAFGTKGGNIAAADDWAEQYNSRKAALIAMQKWGKTARWTYNETSDHLF
jgi:hypothetical protein